MPADVFLDQDARQTRLEGLRWSLQLTDRTLSGIGKVQLTFQTSSSAAANASDPAYSIGTDIFINTDLAKPVTTDRGIASMLGLNYHELAHVVYTWYKDDEIRNAISALGHDVPAQFSDAYNILEEARVESLLAARYPRMEKYFTLILADYIVGSSRPDTFLVVHGRKYLPKRIRSMYRQHYAAANSQQQADIAERVIDEYRTIVFPDDMKTAARLIYEFCQILPVTSSRKKPHHGTVSGSAGDPSAGQNKRGAKKDAEKAKQREGQDDGVPDGDARENDEGELSPSDQGGGKGQEGDGSQPGDQGAGELDGDDPADRDPAGGGGSSRADRAPSQNPRHPSLKDIEDELRDLAEEVLQDSVVQDDIQSTRETMEDVRNGLHSSLERHTARAAQQYAVTAAMRERSERYAEELRRIWLAMEPGWVYGASEGRLDMNRVFGATTPEEMEDVYASWDPGKQHNSKAVGVLVTDESYSMNRMVKDGKTGRNLGSRDQIAAKNIWEIKNACREVDVDLAVITYDHTYRLLYDFDEQVDLNVYAYPRNGGNTKPEGAVSEARRILGQTEAKGKFLIVLSDGEWEVSNLVEASFASMDDVVKGCGLIDFLPGKPWKYEKDFDIVRRSSGDMFGLMSEVVTTIMTRNLEGW